MKLVSVSALLCAAILGFWHFSFPQEQTTPYQFTKIVDTQGGVFRSFHLSPSIDEQGVVLFRANLVGGGQGIFQSNGSVTTQIATTTENFEAFRGSPAVSDNGKIVFLGSRSRKDFGYSRGTAITGDFIYSNKEFAELGDLAINNGGTLAFKGKKAKGRRQRKQVFLGDGGRTIAIPDSKNREYF